MPRFALLLLAALSAPALAEEGRPVSAAECPAHLDAIAPKLEASGYKVERAAEAAGKLLRATYSEPAGSILIEYRCAAEGLAVTIENRGLPNIPFQVLLAAGPSAVLKQSMPDWLRDRYEAVSN